VEDEPLLQSPSPVLARLRHAAMSELSPLSGVMRKSDLQTGQDPVTNNLWHLRDELARTAGYPNRADRKSRYTRSTDWIWSRSLVPQSNRSNRNIMLYDITYAANIDRSALR
jgi:hypothetical protein